MRIFDLRCSWRSMGLQPRGGILIRRTLMQCNQELVDFEIDPITGEAHIIDAAGDDLLASVGLIRQNGNQVLARLVERRALSPLRKDKDDVIAAFGAKSAIDLALMGRGLSLCDLFWYRSPGSFDCWEDVNFFDNGRDPAFGAAVLSGDYGGLGACSLDVPEATTPGHAVKAWEHTDDGIFLVHHAARICRSYCVGESRRGSSLGVLGFRLPVGWRMA